MRSPPDCYGWDARINQAPTMSRSKAVGGEAEHFNPSHPLESVARGEPTLRTRCYGYSDGYGTRRINQAPTMRRSDAKGKRE